MRCFAICWHGGERYVSLNFGADFYAVGDKLNVFARNADSRIYDPYTKEFISWDESLLGTVTLTRTLPKLSFGQLEASEESASLIREHLNGKEGILSRRFVAYKIEDKNNLPGDRHDRIKEKTNQLKEQIESEF